MMYAWLAGISPRTIRALRAARSAGFVVIAATGRAPLSAMARLAAHDVVDALVCSNGSIVHDVRDDVTTHRSVIDPDHVESLFTTLDAAIPDLAYCWEMNDGSGWDEAFHDTAVGHDDLSTFAVGPRPGRDVAVTKVLVRHPGLVRRELSDALRPHLPAPLTLGCSGVDFVEITGVGVDKASALQRVVGDLGFAASDVVAFGDNHNDVEMLTWAGHGVAVANALDAVKAIVDEVIGHHADDAVARYVERLVATVDR